MVGGCEDAGFVLDEERLAGVVGELDVDQNVEVVVGGADCADDIGGSSDGFQFAAGYVGLDVGYGCDGLAVAAIEVDRYDDDEENCGRDEGGREFGAGLDYVEFWHRG